MLPKTYPNFDCSSKILIKPSESLIGITVYHSSLLYCPYFCRRHIVIVVIPHLLIALLDRCWGASIVTFKMSIFISRTIQLEHFRLLVTINDSIVTLILITLLGRFHRLSSL